jgi:hypothetical protein
MEHIETNAKITAAVDGSSRHLDRLRYLAFDAHMTRVLIEIAAGSLLAFIIMLTLTSTALVEGQTGSALISALIGFVTVGYIDYLVFGSSHRIIRRVRTLQYQGKYVEAVAALQEIAPDKEGLTLSKVQYANLRSQILAESGYYRQAVKSWNSIKGLVDETRFVLTQFRLACISGQTLDADRKYSELKACSNPGCGIKLEQVLMRFNRRTCSQTDRDYLQQVITKRIHHDLYGYSVSLLADAYFQVTRLWSGYAEEALKELSWRIDDLSLSVYSKPHLRTSLAELLLERAFYQATHREPESAIADAKIALELCRTRKVNSLLKEVNEELEWRFDMSVPVEGIPATCENAPEGN